MNWPSSLVAIFVAVVLVPGSYSWRCTMVPSGPTA
jgi:hypothetical protein